MRESSNRLSRPARDVKAAPPLIINEIVATAFQFLTEIGARSHYSIIGYCSTSQYGLVAEVLGPRRFGLVPQNLLAKRGMNPSPACHN